MGEQAQIVRRSISIVFDDGGLLALTSALPERGAEYGDEEVTAVLCEADRAPVSFQEALLSTEYDEHGVQRRATLELWSDVEDMRPVRGAGTLISSTQVRHHELDSEIAFFRWSIEGREGLGTYEVARAAAHG